MTMNDVISGRANKIILIQVIVIAILLILYALGIIS